VPDQAALGIGWGALGAAMAATTPLSNTPGDAQQFANKPIARPTRPGKARLDDPEIVKGQLLASHIGRQKTKAKPTPRTSPC